MVCMKKKEKKSGLFFVFLMWFFLMTLFQSNCQWWACAEGSVLQWQCEDRKRCSDAAKSWTKLISHLLGLKDLFSWKTRSCCSPCCQDLASNWIPGNLVSKRRNGSPQVCILIHRYFIDLQGNLQSPSPTSFWPPCQRSLQEAAGLCDRWTLSFN